MIPRIEEIANNMPGDGGVNYFSVQRTDLIAALEAAYWQGHADGRSTAGENDGR